MRPHLPLALAALSAVCGAACDAPPSAPDASPALDAGIDARTPLTLCTAPDRACPEVRAFPGAPCEGDLACTWELYEGRCVDGAWELTPICGGTSCGSPILSEGCSTPFTGVLEGARVVVGPPDEDRAYADGEEVAIVWGAQGFPMIPYAIRIEDAASPPDCIELEKHVRSGEGALEMGATLRMHCGMSRLAYAVVPGPYPCAAGEHPIDLTVTVDGIGESTAHLIVRGGSCPPGSL